MVVMGRWREREEMRGRESVGRESIATTRRWCRPEGGIDVGFSEDEDDGVSLRVWGE